MKVFDTIQKSKSDPRNYKAITLSNQIQCLLISDPDTQKSAAALSVGIGSFKDPIETQGLAHYLEHMLFMGTEKYPDENDYSNFITKNSGMNNAYTAQEQTNYQFEVSSKVFKETLDRFAQFFISPLMSESSSEREINAVDSEHSKNLNNDTWRKFQLTKHLAKKDHPYNKFSTGDKTTLQCQNLRKMLQDFYYSNYSSNLMKMVLYGKQNVDVLAEWASQLFSIIPNKELNKFKITEQPYDDNTFKKLIKIVPVKDKKKMEVQWILPDKKHYYKTKPENILAQLIGHEGKNSLLSFLIKEGLVTGIMAGGSDSYDCYSEFFVIFQLTDDGVVRYKEILGYMFYYIQMLKKKTVPEWFFEEAKYINKMKFDFLDKKKGMMQTASIASNLHKRKMQEVISHPYLMQEWKPEVIQTYLSELTQQNMFVILISQDFSEQCTSIEPVYKTKFTKEDLEIITPIECEVDLPENNIFIPKDLSVVPLIEEKKPEKLYSSDLIQAYFKRDHLFKLPKVNLSIRLSFPSTNCPLSQVSTAIYLQMLNQYLRQFTYLAETAHIQADSSFISYFSLQIKIKCYRDSLGIFLSAYLDKIFNFVPENTKIYENMIHKKRREYANYFYSDAYLLSYNFSTYAMRVDSTVLPELKEQEIENVTLERVKVAGQDWKQKLFCQSYLGGNMEAESAQKVFIEIEDKLRKYSKPLSRSYIPQIRPIKLEKQRTAIIQYQLRNKQEDNSSVLVHFQTQRLNIKTSIIQKLCETAIRQPAFDYLRTKHQLGYIVFFLSEDHRGMGGFAILIQSSVKTSYQLISYIDMFINQTLKQKIDNMTEDEFSELKASLKHTKEENDKDFSSESLRYWNQIVKHQYIFDRKQREIKEIEGLTLTEFKEYIHEHLYRNPKRLETHISNTQTAELNNKVKEERLKAQDSLKIYKNIPSFLKECSLLPDYYCP